MKLIGKYKRKHFRSSCQSIIFLCLQIDIFSIIIMTSILRQPLLVQKNDKIIASPTLLVVNAILKPLFAVLFTTFPVLNFNRIYGPELCKNLLVESFLFPHKVAITGESGRRPYCIVTLSVMQSVLSIKSISRRLRVTVYPSCSIHVQVQSKLYPYPG